MLMKGTPSSYRDQCLCLRGFIDEEATHPGNCISEHGLPTAWGSMEENTVRGLDTSVQINLWVAQRHRD